MEIIAEKGSESKTEKQLEGQPKPAKKTKDLELVILVRSSEEEISSLNRLCDMIITCALSEYEIVLTEKESKVLLTYQKNLRSVRIVLQEPDRPQTEKPIKVRTS